MILSYSDGKDLLASFHIRETPVSPGTLIWGGLFGVGREENKRDDFAFALKSRGRI